MSETEETEINDEPIHFPLLKSFQYGTKSGDSVEATWVELNPPTTKNSRECAYLKQAFFRASNETSSDEGETRVEGDAKGPTGAGVIAVMAMSTSVDLAETMEVARKLFTSKGIALVQGEMKLTLNLIEKMSQDDFEGMLGEYLVNFTLASALALATKTPS